jgi:hypothetical protein
LSEKITFWTRSKATGNKLQATAKNDVFDKKIALQFFNTANGTLVVTVNVRCEIS